MVGLKVNKNGVLKMRKLLISTMCLITTIAFAGSEPTASPFPGAKNGINIWPIKKINASMNKEMKLKSYKTLDIKGYNETNTTDESVNSLLGLPNIAAKETRQYAYDPNPLDTHLKSSVSKIRLSFKFSGIPGIEKENVFGFAAGGGYTHEKGWDGVIEFFRMPNLGICSFSTYSIVKVIVPKENVQYLVNKKISDQEISGNRMAGFLYRVEWFTDTRSYSLECANKELKKENLKEMIKIANQIDVAMD
jgi:hypothetical protein